ENMKCVVQESVIRKCDEFVINFINSNTSRVMGNIFHDKNWKETEAELVKVTDRILGTLGEILNNPAFSTSASRSEQSEGTYITDVIVPLLRSTLGNLPNGMDEMRIGKKPDIMGLLKSDEKSIELLYIESSRIICSKSKKDDDDVKLWRETLDGASFIGLSCRPSHQFGVVGIQVAGTVMRLNVLVKDSAGIPR
ncbi:1212_t:CDS:2, partial [Paraglomus occultum]